MPCIGIASWGYTTANEQLEHQHKTFPSSISAVRSTRSITRQHSQAPQSVRVVR